MRIPHWSLLWPRVSRSDGTSGLAMRRQVAEGDRFVAVRAQPARADAATGELAIVAPLLTQVAALTAATLVDGGEMRR